MLNYILSSHSRRLSRVNEFNYRFAASPQKLEFLQKKYALEPSELDYIEAADPTKKGIYLDWVARMFKKKMLRFPEDVNKIRGALSSFDKVKVQGFFDDEKDINRYEAPLYLYKTVKKYQELEGLNLPMDQIKREQVEGAEPFIRGSGYTWYKVTTPEAACSLGSGTSWCTVHEKWSRDYLSQGPLYILYVEGEPRLQFHFESSQFMDEYDSNVMDIHPYKGKFYSFYDDDFIDTPFFEEVEALLNKLGVEFGDWSDLEAEKEEEDLEDILADLANGIEERYEEGEFNRELSDAPDFIQQLFQRLFLTNWSVPPSELENLYRYLTTSTDTYYEVDLNSRDEFVGQLDLARLVDEFSVEDLYQIVNSDPRQESLPGLE